MTFVNWFVELLDKKVKAYQYEKQITEELEKTVSNSNWDWKNYDDYVDYVLRTY